MTLVPTDGVVGIITTLHKQSPAAADTLYRLALYESLADQIDARRPEMEAIVLKNMADINASARRSMLRTHVGKALEGQPEPDDLDYAEGLAMLDEYVEIRKDLTGALLAAFNRGVNRDDHGRFSRQPGRRNIGPVNIAHPGQEHRQEQAAVDLMGLALHASQRQGDRMTQNLFHDGQVKQHGDQIAGELYGRGEAPNRQAYNRMRVTGQALAGASNPGSLAHTVGSVAELAGNLGPEAEKVLGPGIRRTAYRYRGTERRPEQSVVSAVGEANQLVAAIDGNPQQQAIAASRLESASRAKGGRDIVPQITAQWTSPSVTPDKRALAVRGDAAAAALLAVDGKRHESVLPDLDLVRLSLESGEMPPSQGVIIDSEGTVTSQAVGYNGDHYLPFDLRNLGSLHGGQYVRSRATGGPTTEDIYTGLLTGARQVQVVSNSGVFTIEFDPELRGGRRYNDKARRMVERYGAMIDTIGDPNSNLFEPGAGLPPELVADLRAKAAQASRTSDEFNTKFRELQTQAQLKAAVSETEMAEVDEAARNVGQARAKQAFEQAAAAGQPMSPQQRAQMATDEARAYKKKNQPVVRKLKLDGIGYGQAMKALKQEFPYYIRSATFVPLPEWMAQYGFNNPELGYRQHAPSDLGHVERGQTNTPKAQGGGRKVPRQSQKGGATAATQNAAAPNQQNQQAQQPQQGQPNQQNTGTTPGQRPKVTLADLAKPGSPLVRRATTAGVALTNAIKSAGDPFDMPVDLDGPELEKWIDIHTDGFNYLKAKTQLMGSSRSGSLGSEFTTWFLTQANEHEVEKVQDGLETMLKMSKNNSASFADAGIPDTPVLEAAVNELLGHYEMLHPFMDLPPGVDPNEVEPDRTDRPPKMPGVPEVTDSPEDFQYKKANLVLENKELEEAIDILARQDPADRVKYVVDTFNDVLNLPNPEDREKPEAKKLLADTNTAWSFVHAQDIAEKLRPYLGGDAGPFIKAARPRRRLLFAKSDPSYSQAVDRLLGPRR